MDEGTKKIIDQVKSETDLFSKGKLLFYLTKEKDIPVNRLAKIFLMSSAQICHLIRLLRLPEIIIDGYYSEIISVSHLINIARLKNKQDMIAVYEEVLSKNLTVAQTDELVREKLFQIKTNGKRIDENTKRKIEEKYKKIDKNLQVKIVQTRVRAKVILTIRGGYKKTTEILKKILNC